MGAGSYPALLSVKAISSTFPKTVTVFLVALLVNSQTPNVSDTEHCDGVRPDPLNTGLPQHHRRPSAQHPRSRLHSQQHRHCCTHLHLTAHQPNSLRRIPCFCKAITCRSRTDTAITRDADSANKRVSQLLPQNLCFPSCPHSKFPIWYNDQEELITPSFKQRRCAREKIHYHPTYNLIQSNFS